ncbi:DnaJ domain-containing protein, putative [Eimeria tenella]|uniref:DnaJ domain-containing protein, putative n=1 Tax=Eimeria tenella TaxID=5802 RepID=U6LAI7_EIMTE|nr:DnaJ domain-containing protein, putative [Eimeria tenella]CDJ44790.1 DnaJ domain-containing protein, putative [Eimeria tenella]|eukprot:XP_013235538.1 DnaJ domain-containing protein, putative [Eimeria tenella]
MASQRARGAARALELEWGATQLSCKRDADAATRKFEDILAFISDKVAKHQTTLTHENMEDWLTSNPQKTKVVLFARKRPAPPEWYLGAFFFKSQLDIGIVFPSEKDLILDYFREPTKFNNMHAVTYMEIPSLLVVSDLDTLQGEWRKVRGMPPDKFISTLASVANQARVPRAKTLHPLTRRRMRAGECTPQDSQICVLLLLPSKTAAWGSAREVYSSLKELAAKYKTDPVKLVYVAADKNPVFAAAFGFPPSSKEEMVIAYRPKRRRYLRLEPPVTKQGLEEFVDRVIGGAPLPEKLKGEPVLGAAEADGGSHDEL